MYTASNLSAEVPFPGLPESSTVRLLPVSQKWRMPIEDREADEERKAKSNYDLIRMRLERLQKNIDKPAYIPTRREEAKPKAPPEFVRNVVGSSAAAGSAEFHIFRNNRRKEMERLEYIAKQAEKEDKDLEYEERVQSIREAEEARTAKKRAKRQRRKENLKKNKKQKKEEPEESQEESEEEEPEDVEKEEPSTETKKEAGEPRENDSPAVDRPKEEEIKA
ncbi:hypothetical protein QR680_012413 [Steinernema hermaphroditum]|uniref:PRKR-interacting protein 1 homolog n=1 Tax=Steinernema hermaphroditum TaxID=289476 RepID=A0AA39I1Y7_9BILA|nr:hypothetical protein QR680_012413 [Steinernema hermaphroditum]